MGLLDGLKGGEGFYWGAPLMQYENMQRPQPISLPANRNTNAAKSDNKIEYLPGDTGFLHLQKTKLNTLERKIESGDITEDELKEYSALSFYRDVNERIAYHNQKDRENFTSSKDYLDNANNIYLDKNGMFHINPETGKIMTVQEYVALSTSFDPTSLESPMLRPWAAPDVNFSAKYMMDVVSDTFKEATGSTQAAREIPLNISNLLPEDQYRNFIKVSSSTNEAQLTSAGIQSLNKIFSDRKALGGAMIAFGNAVNTGSQFLGEELYSTQEINKRKLAIQKGDLKEGEDYTVKDMMVKGKKHKYYQFKATNEDFIPWVQNYIRNEEQMRLKTTFDFQKYFDKGSGAEEKENLKVSELEMMAMNAKEVKPLASTSEVSLGFIKGDVIPDLFNQNGELVNKDFKGYEKVAKLIMDFRNVSTAMVNSGAEIPFDTYFSPETASMLQANGVRTWMDYAKFKFVEENKSSEIGLTVDKIEGPLLQKAINHFVTEYTIQNISEVADFQQMVKEKSEKMHAEGGRSYYISTGMVVTSVNGTKPISPKVAMAGLISGMTLKDYMTYAGNMTTYKITPDHFKGTTFEHSRYVSVDRQNDPRVSILGTVQKGLMDASFDGKRPLFMPGDRVHSGFPMQGESVLGLEGYYVIPSKSKVLKKIQVNTILNEEGKPIDLATYSVEGFRAYKQTLTQDDIDQMPPGSGYKANEEVYLLPATMDFTDQARQSKKFFDFKAYNDTKTFRMKTIQEAEKAESVFVTTAK